MKGWVPARATVTEAARRPVFTNDLGPILAARLMTPFDVSVLLYDQSPGAYRQGRQVIARWRRRSPTAEAIIANRFAPLDSWTRRTWARL